MAKISKEELARIGGAQWLLQIATQNGIEAAQKELEWRSSANIPLGINKADYEATVRRLSSNCFKSILAMALLTLRDEFSFGHDRAMKFMERFETKAECICDDYTNWRETLDLVRDEMGINLELSDDVWAEERRLKNGKA